MGQILETIIINTNSDEELARIKALLPAEHRDKVIKNPVYNEVLAFQQESYNNMVHSYSAERFNDISYPFSQSRMAHQINTIAGFVGDEYLPFKQAIAQFSFPTSIESFAKYKEEVTDFIKAKKQQINADNAQALTSSRITGCADKLQNHVDLLNKMKVEKETKAPGFFTENPNVSLKVAQKIDAISKAINYLKGEADLTFSPEEMAVLNKGSVGEVLEKHSITLPSIPLENPTP